MPASGLKSKMSIAAANRNVLPSTLTYFALSCDFVVVVFKQDLLVSLQACLGLVAIQLPQLLGTGITGMFSHVQIQHASLFNTTPDDPLTKPKDFWERMTNPFSGENWHNVT